MVIPSVPEVVTGEPVTPKMLAAGTDKATEVTLPAPLPLNVFQSVELR